MLMFHFINISSKFVQTFCPICKKASECLMQRTMLPAVPATDERLIAPGYQHNAYLLISNKINEMLSTTYGIKQPTLC